MVLKVKLILGEFTFLVGGNLCSQLVCVPFFITNKLPFSKTISILRLFSLCLNENLRATPKEIDAIAPFFFNIFSPILILKVNKNMCEDKDNYTSVYE